VFLSPVRGPLKEKFLFILFIMSCQAQLIEIEAEKKLKSYTFSWLFGDKDKNEAAGELYVKAANAYKIDRNLLNAGDAYIRAANCFLNASIKHEAASYFVKASNAYKKDNFTAASTAMAKAIDLYIEEGRLNMAAKYELELAGMYETDNDIPNAINHYEAAADLYENENSTSSSNECLLKVAHIEASLENFPRAVELFEKVANASLSNHLLKWNIRQYFLKAGLCHIASHDVVASKKAIERYTQLSRDFQGTREYKFLIEIVEASKNFDEDAFQTALIQFDSILKIEPWKIAILVKIANKIKTGGVDDLT